jgi:hypothetical protein
MSEGARDVQVAMLSCEMLESGPDLVDSAETAAFS